MTEDEIREFKAQSAIEGNLGQWLSQKIWDETSLSLGNDQFRPLYAEESEELGFDDDPDAVLLRRESDGNVYEVEIDIKVLPVLPEAEQAEAAGQLPLPGVPA